MIRRAKESMTQFRNIGLLISYDGTDFHGWQRQPNALTVQGCLESAIERILGEKAQVCGSGRTDAGVHALNQVANFKTKCSIPCDNLMRALNNTLQSTVRIKDVQEMPLRFHARHDARSKTYRYRILQAPVASPFFCRFAWHYPYPLDINHMAQAAKFFEGEHDFSSFAAAEGDIEEEEVCDAEERRRVHPRVSKSMVRRVLASRIFCRPRTSILVYEVSGNGFLHHMVRNIVGTLLEVGRGKLQPSDVVRILKARDRTLAGPTAPAQGLCLVSVDY